MNSEVSDYPGGFIIVKAGFGRVHLFASEARDEILRKLQEKTKVYRILIMFI